MGPQTRHIPVVSDNSRHLVRVAPSAFATKRNSQIVFLIPPLRVAIRPQAGTKSWQRSQQAAADSSETTEVQAKWMQPLQRLGRTAFLDAEHQVIETRASRLDTGDTIPLSQSRRDA